jgi:hypothetical protein
MTDGFQWWCLCEVPTGISWRRYGESSPPGFEQAWDAGTACTPLAVDGSGNVYTFSGTGPGGPSALTKWNASGVLQWSLPVTGTPGGVCVSPDGTKVVFVGNLQQPNVTVPPLTPTAMAFQTGSSGTVTVGDADDTIVQPTDYIALQFTSPLPPYATVPSCALSVYCPVADESTASVSLYFETVASSAALAATANNISSRTTSGGGNTPQVWFSGAESLGEGWHSPPTGGLTWLGSLTQLEGYAAGNPFTLILQGHQVAFQPLGDLNLSLAADPTLAPQLAITYAPPAQAAICCDTATGAIVWTLARQPLEGEGISNLTKALWSPDGTGIFSLVPQAGFSTGGGIVKLDAAAGSFDWFSIVPSSAINTIGDFTFGPTGTLYATDWASSDEFGGLYILDPSLGGWTFLGGTASGWPVGHLTAFADGSWGATDSVGNYVRFTAGSVSTDPLVKSWSFAKQGFEGYAGAATDGTHAFLVNGGQLVRVNAEGTADYSYTIPLVPPLVAGVSLQPAAILALDSNNNPYVGGTYVQFEAPG